ncbi:MAG: pilus assembly protein TadG-related protein [Anaerolineales bacterium]
MNRKYPKELIKTQKGATMVFVAICIFILVAFTALAVDLGHLFVAHNELQNAADAGALAGARFLYTNNGQTINVDANQVAYDAAVANISESTSVEVNEPLTNYDDVQRGHWSFGLGILEKGFYRSDNTTPVNLYNVTTQQLDEDQNHINAVKVITRREQSEIASFFAKIFGYAGFQQSAEAVAYIGFAGTLLPTEADQPIAICKQSITDSNGTYSGCNIGRMLNSGSNDATHNTAGWTNFSQPCDTANASEMRDLICAGGNPEPVTYGEGIGATGGVQDNVFRELRDCWIDSDDSPGPDGLPNEPWSLTLPVVDCPGNNVSNCPTLLGAVTVQVVFMSPEGGTPDWDDAPTEMAGWQNSDPDGQVRWDSFVQHFALKNVDDLYADYAKKSIYFLPTCEPHEPAGLSGGENFGILAKIPVLVD